LLGEGKVFEEGGLRSCARAEAGGRLFIDGPHELVDVGMGDRLIFRRSSEPLFVLGLHGRRK
jgi:hypothetical protein